MNEPMKRCKQCREIKPLSEFVRTGKSSYADDDPRSRKPRCSECEVTNRTEPKNDRRERHKARDTRCRHAKKFGIPIEMMETYYGWDLDQIEADIIEVRDHGCERCRKVKDGVVVFNYVPRSLDEIHIDIFDPTEAPFYGVNAGPVCFTCNLRKGPRTVMRCQIEQAEREAIVRQANRPGQLSLLDLL